ncbi:hypothetical protein BKA59DRAFT_192019 [Fusarium tricinctum]|uniref:Hsp70 protein n=1 Tax=Fusarium tricinctum TaxID=61284 RepID=A0A8K0WBU8_9HYPO|nr:hypothetical protein BKA59DRAFT_192019 [Fusarium tricinctum]
MASREATPTGQPTRRQDVFAGIDFGTTYSKVAFAVPNLNNQAHPIHCVVHCLKAFSFKGFQLSTKYPTGTYNSSGCDGKWLEWFKLSLLHKDDLPHDLQVTVPVVWPADARRRLYQAIQSANILGSNVRLARKFVTEAEAAGIALMSATSVYSGNLEGSGFQVEDTFIICDCGGGTT